MNTNPLVIRHELLTEKNYLVSEPERAGGTRDKRSCPKWVWERGFREQNVLCQECKERKLKYIDKEKG